MVFWFARQFVVGLVCICACLSFLLVCYVFVLLLLVKMCLCYLFGLCDLNLLVFGCGFSDLGGRLLCLMGCVVDVFRYCLSCICWCLSWWRGCVVAVLLCFGFWCLFV